MRILLIEDDAVLGAAVRDQIVGDGHSVDWVQRLDAADTAIAGVPYDLVGTIFPPIFKAFTEAWPSVELTIVCGTSPELAEGIARGELDVAVVEAPVDEATGECLCVERLVWVGPRGGNVHAKRPLPLSMVDESCAFRARVLKALGEHGIEWRTVFESGNIEATTATVRTGLAVTASSAFGSANGSK